MTFNPENFTDSKNKFFLLNGRSYPDTVGGYTCAGAYPGGDSLPACAGKSAGDVVAGPMQTQSADGVERTAQPMPAVINIPVGGKALLRISDLETNEYQTLASLGIPMKVIALNARLLRDLDGNDLSYHTNSITLAGGESLDVILDACNRRVHHAGPEVLPVHAEPRPPVERRRELRRPDDGSKYLRLGRSRNQSLRLLGDLP